MTNTLYVLKCEEKDKKAISKKAYDFVICLAKENFGAENELEIVADENGKPYFKNHPDFYFNISHSGDLIAVAFSSSPVGVDIEKLRDANLKIAERRFTDKEKQFIKNNLDFFYVWTRKEAYLKRTGKGLRQSLSTFSVLDENTIKTFKADDYIVSVCGDNAKDFSLII